MAHESVQGIHIIVYSFLCLKLAFQHFPIDYLQGHILDGFVCDKGYLIWCSGMKKMQMVKLLMNGIQDMIGHPCRILSKSKTVYLQTSNGNPSKLPTN